MSADTPIDYEPRPRLSADFVADQLEVTWSDLAWAASNHWLDLHDLSRLSETLAGDDVDTQVSIAIAASERDETSLADIIRAQAAKYPTPKPAVRERWAHVATAWAFRHRDRIDDPLGAVEQIWEAFDHPDALAGLIRWMPVPAGGRPGIEGLMDRWQSVAETRIPGTDAGMTVRTDGLSQ